MHLLRVQVPHFRALRDVDITFEPDFRPRIFPLGSQNGGGKSTLLQLIFTLLHCSFVEERKQFLCNMLADFRLPEGFDRFPLATITISHGGQEAEIVFFIFAEGQPSHNDTAKFIVGEQNSNQPVSFEVCSLYSKPNSILACCIQTPNQKFARFLSGVLADRVFLAAPSTQIFLFLGRERNRLLFKKKEAREYFYEKLLRNTMAGMPGLFTYDFVDVDILIDAFNSAGDKDFRQAIQTGKYGNTYQTLLSELNSLLLDKNMNLSIDLSEIIFRNSNGDSEQLYPEDLSHGELRRLSIYTWLYQKKIDDCIVLMDEIEIALHPDWQYRIVSDLEEWAPNNQYILATHSYHICEALTPAHVKEIEPKLLPQQVEVDA